MTTLKEEKRLLKTGYSFIIGIDEVGRGTLAGPVMAAACMIKADINLLNSLKKISKLKDSKKLSEKNREKFYKIFKDYSVLKWSTAFISEKIIDKINIQKATELAMEKAVGKLKLDFAKNKNKIFLLIDGNRLSNQKLKSFNHKLIIKGDEKVFLIAVASIIAKVVRDGMMKKYSVKYPEYNFAKHKGYGTKEHFKLIKKYGLSKIHRKSFCRNIVIN